MVSRLEQLEQLTGLDVEVDALEPRVRRIPRARGHDEPVVLRKRTLREPSRVATRAVDENEPRPGPRDLDVQLGP